MNRRLRIAQVAPPMERVPPRAYGGTEHTNVYGGSTYGSLYSPTYGYTTYYSQPSYSRGYDRDDHRYRDHDRHDNDRHDWSMTFQSCGPSVSCSSSSESSTGADMR